MKAIPGILLGFVVMVPAQGQATKKNVAGGGYTVSRTPDGQPDLQGIWTNATLTPLQRPLELGSKAFYTPKEAKELEKQGLDSINSDRTDGDGAAKLGRNYNEFWKDRGGFVPSRRTSLITDTADGRIPPLTPQGQKIADARDERRKLHPSDGPEFRNAFERCIVASNAGPPMMPYNYNSNFQIVQIPGYVIIFSEQIHDARVIPLDGRPHLPPNVHQWKGYSRGHWEGNTLVVETTNFTGKTNFFSINFQVNIDSESLRLMERFTRTRPDMILYQFTVDDPAIFTKPWTAEMPLNSTDGPIFEYACHEANQGLANMLSAARAEEKAAPKPVTRSSSKNDR